MGATALAAITMIQVFILIDLLVVFSRAFFDRFFLKPYVNGIGFFLGLTIVVLLIYNYRKYNGTYNKYRTHWKDETKAQLVIKGILVVASILLPWVPLILISIFTTE